MKYLLDGEKSERISFRKILKSDFDDWLEFYKNPKTREHWIEKRDSPEKDCEKWYDKQYHRYENDLGGMNALVEKETGKLIGHCGLLVQTVDQVTELEIGYSLLPAFWKKGFASEAADTCKTFSFENDFADTLISIISLTNKPSEKVALHNGMWLDKQTEYNGNQVNIFRINKSDWVRPNH